jgi:hypothetical protein
MWPARQHFDVAPVFFRQNIVGRGCHSVDGDAGGLATSVLREKHIEKAVEIVLRTGHRQRLRIINAHDLLPLK